VAPVHVDAANAAAVSFIAFHYRISPVIGIEVVIFVVPIVTGAPPVINIGYIESVNLHCPAKRAE
jgi:hypothetical protein